jgi:hypothetical protein
MFCPKCGVQPVSDASPFCTQCGAPVKASAQAPIQAAGVAPVSVAVPGTRKTGTKLWLWAALFGFVLLGSAALYFRSGSEVKGIWATDSDVNIVRNGVLKAHNTTTVGKAFEGTFQNAKWTSFETPKGATVVEFNGKVQPDVLSKNGFGSSVDEDRLTQECSAPLADKIAAQLHDTAEHSKQHDSEKTELYEREKKLYPTEAQWAAAQPTLKADYQALRDKWAQIEAADQETKKQIGAVISKCVAEKLSGMVVPVKVQFLLSADKKTFTINYVENKVFGWRKQDEILQFIYR